MKVGRSPFAAPLLAAAASLLPGQARASDPAFGPYDVPTVFFINKSDDHNRVDYGMRLSASCEPVGKEPVFPYWREFERSPPVRTHGLGAFEYFAYGISKQQLIRKLDGGTEWRIALKRFEREVIIVTSKDSGGHCTAVAKTTVAGVPRARLLSVFVKLKGLLSVAYLDVSGVREETGEPLTERLTP